MVATGLSNQEIGARLNLAEKTVKHYMTSILGKLHVRSRVEAALLAQKAGIGPHKYHTIEHRWRVAEVHMCSQLPDCICPRNYSKNLRYTGKNEHAQEGQEL